MFNPDAIGQWLYEKYPNLFTPAVNNTEIEIPLKSIVPIVTPACFATMYTGAQPSVHKVDHLTSNPVEIDTIFDALIRAGKKPVIVATKSCSVGTRFVGRNMDYFLTDTMDEANAKMAELILKDEHDFYVVYNGSFDAQMHKHTPESPEALSEIKANARIFAMFSKMIEEKWIKHRTLVGFAMDHGSQDMDGGGGTHWPETEKDLNIVHLYKIYA